METLHPGQYWQEVPGEQPIEGVSTSTAAFVGVSEKGVIGKAGFVTSWNDFVKQYGGYLENSYLAYAVRGFFQNGGTRAFISRAVHFENNGGTFVKSSKPATFELSLNTGTEEEPVQEVIGIFDAFTDGTWGNDVEVEILAGDEAGQYKINVYEDGQVIENFADNITHETLEDIINSTSTIIQYTPYDTDLELPLGKFKLAGGDDGVTGLVSNDYLGDPSLGNGLHAFDNINVNIVAIPGITDVSTAQGLITYVEGRRDCVYIGVTPLGSSPMDAVQYKQTDANISSNRANLYYSWLQVSDPIGIGKNPIKVIPPEGHIAGIYARTDNTRGVWKAPAGLQATVRGVIGLEYNVNDAEQDILNPIGINAIRAFEGEGIVLWGARTCSSLSEWRYTNVRRSADFVIHSILGGTRWAVFEPNDPILWGKISASASAFLTSFWRAGGLRGASESDAFFVVCDSTTTTADDIDNGRLYADIGIAPQKPAEFLIFRLSLLK